MKLRNERGFTMIEILVATVIVGLVAAMVVPSFDSAIKKIYWRDTATDILSTLRSARSHAIAKQSQCGVVWDPSTNRFTVFVDKVNKPSFSFDLGDSILLVDSIEANSASFYTSFTGNTLFFFPNGRASQSGTIGGSSYSEGLYQSMSLSVLAATGRVTIDYLYN
jgi:type II secretion system protein H